MTTRRELLATLVLCAATPCALYASSVRLSFSGSLEQGSLVVGKTAPGARVTVDGARVRVSSAGNFAFGLTYDQTKPATVAATFADGTSEAQQVAPVARQYEIQRIAGLAEKFVTLPPEVLERRKREIAMIVAARTKDSDEDGFDEPFDWPAQEIVSGLFGSQRILNGKPMEPHFGVDIAAGAGATIRAPAPALVVLAGPDFYLEGGLTILDHGHGVTTCYLHQSRQLVKEGDRIDRGQPIGLVGKTGRATGPHLHWGMNWFQMRLDPSRSTRTPHP